MRIVVEVTRASLRLLAVEGAPMRPVIRQWIVDPLEDPARVRRALAALPGARRDVISAIARDQVLTRLLTLPSAQPEELAQMAVLAGKAQLPYPAEQTVTALDVMAQQAGSSTAQLVACHRDVIDRHVALLRQVGGEPAVITPSAWGLLAWYQRWGRSPATPEPALVVHVDADHTDVVLIRDGRLVCSRSLSQGAEEWAGVPDGAESMLRELDYSVAGWRKELPGLEVRACVCTGVGPLDRWAGALAQHWGLPSTVQVPQGALRLPASSSTEASPAAALGLAMADAARLVNLLPPTLRQAQQVRQRLRALTVTSGLLAAALVVGTGALWLSVDRRERRLAQWTQAARSLQSVSRQAQGLALARRLVVSRRWIAAALTEVFQRTPAEVAFDSLVVEPEQGTLVVRGAAPATRDVLAYLRALEASTAWRQVELRYAARRGAAGDARTDFELVVHR